MIPVSQRMAGSIIKSYTQSQMMWHYEHGLVLQSIFQLGIKTGQEKLCDYVKTMYDTKITPDGEILSYREGDFNLDQINPGKTLFLLHNKYGGGQYRTAIEKLRDQLRGQPRTKKGGFWHKQIYPWQMWLDGLYMQGPFYAQYAAEYGDVSDFDDVAYQFVLIKSKARDAETGLLYHAWDESKSQAWADKETGCSPHFWGRALGWYCMALVDSLDFFPASNANYNTLVSIAQDLVGPLLSFQDSMSGLWYQVLNMGNEKGNYTESSASSMFVYFLLKMLRKSLIPRNYTEAVKAAAVKAYQGLLEHKLREDANGDLHLRGICKVAGLGGKPYRDGSYEYYVNEPVTEDDFKGIGPFILASMEYESLNALN